MVAEEQLRTEPGAAEPASVETVSEENGSEGHELSGNSGTDYSETHKAQLAQCKKQADCGDIEDYTDEEANECEEDPDAEGEDDGDNNADKVDDNTKCASHVREVSFSLYLFLYH